MPHSTLLHWAIVEPTEQGLSAIRFTSGVSIDTVRVFRSGSRPFAHADAVAETHPDAFYLDLYMSAQPVASNTKEKQKVSNALVHTRLAYIGEDTEYRIDMGVQCSTRLLVLRGDFVRLSLAIYGTVVAEMPPPSTSYVPQPIEALDRTPLHPSFDVANMDDPTHLANALLNTTTSKHTVQEAIATVLSRADKSENDGRAPSDDGATLDDLLEEAQRTWPLNDSENDEFITRMTECMKEMNGSLIASALPALLSTAATLNPWIIPKLLETLREITVLPRVSHIDKVALLELVQATAHGDIANFLDTDIFHQDMATLIADPSFSLSISSAASRLSLRIRGWSVLSDALLNTRADFTIALNFMADLVKDHVDLGVFLMYLSSKHEMLAKLMENPVTFDPPPLSANEAANSHDGFISYFRAFVNMAYVTYVFIWADLQRDDVLLERILCIFRLWQTTEGYREICSKFMLLPDMLSIFENFMRGQTPTKLNLLCQDIMLSLSGMARSYLSTDYREVLHESQPLANASTSTTSVLDECIRLGDSGITMALRELNHDALHDLTTDEVMKVRLALTLLKTELERSSVAEVQLVEASSALDAGSMTILINALSALSRAESAYFHKDVPSDIGMDGITQVIMTIGECLDIIKRVLALHHLPGRQTKHLTEAVASVFVTSWSAEMLFNPETSGSIGVQHVRESCIHILKSMSAKDKNGNNAAHLLQELLTFALVTQTEPSIHLAQSFYLINQIIPQRSDIDENSQHVWTSSVIPTVLPELSLFLHALDVESKVHLSKVLVNLDQGIIGLAEWFLAEESKRLLSVCQVLTTAIMSPDMRVLREYEAEVILRTLDTLVSDGSGFDWQTAFVLDEDTFHMFCKSLGLLTTLRMTTPTLPSLIYTLLGGSGAADRKYPSTLVRALLCNVQLPDTSQAKLERALHVAAQSKDQLDLSSEERPLLDQEASRVVLRYASMFNPNTPMNPAIAEDLCNIIQWLEHPGVLLVDVKSKQFLDAIRASLPTERAAEIQNIQQTNMHQDDDMVTATPRLLSSLIHASIEDVNRWLSIRTRPPATPRRDAGDLGPDLLAMVTVSPSAVLRSPATSTTGLTKTYSQNSFREQTQRTPSNTSRMPSMHVDDFQVSDSPAMPISALFAPDPIHVSDSLQMI